MIYAREQEKVEAAIADRVVVDNGNICAYLDGKSMSLWADNGVYVIKMVDGKLHITSPDE